MDAMKIGLLHMINFFRAKIKKIKERETKQNSCRIVDYLEKYLCWIWFRTFVRTIVRILPQQADKTMLPPINQKENYIFYMIDLFNYRVQNKHI